MYVELHCHDEWSLLDAVGSARHGAERAAELEMPALAKTNHAVLSGVVHHMDACWEVGVMPLVAVEAYYRPNRLVGAYYGKDSLEHTRDSWDYYHMVLIAKDLRGWRSLKLITSEAYRSGFFRKPCIDDDLLDRYHEGLMASTACVRGFIPQAILREDHEAASDHAMKLDRWFGDDWYWELQPHDFDDLRAVNRQIPTLAAMTGKPIAAARDAHAPRQEWIETQHVSVAIRTHKTMSDDLGEETEDDSRYDMMVPDTCYIAGAEQTIEDFVRYHPLLPRGMVVEAVKNTVEIASRCSPFMLSRSPKIPRWSSDKGSNYEVLRAAVYEGLKATGHRHDPAYERQVEHELEILRSKDFVDVFLILWDLIKWCRSTAPLPPLVVDGVVQRGDQDPYWRYTAAGGGRLRPMLVSIRGSAGASCCSYALRITLINPITWGFKFERFLNPDREGLPDFDFDFAPGDADFAKEYIKRNARYGGHDRVYDMVAHGTMAAKAAIGRVATAFGVPHPERIAATKRIDKDDNESDIAGLRQMIPELADFFERHPRVFEHAGRLQRQVGTISEHAAAIVLADRPLDELLPVMKKAKDDDYMVTAFGDASDTQIISSLGFWKLDLLVVIELAKLGYAIDLVQQHHGVEFELDKLPVWEDPRAVDEPTMETIRSGALMGVFQFGGSRSISSLTKRMAPENLVDMSAINAVHRTATMSRGIHNELVERRRDPSKVEYWDPIVADVLAPTSGLMIFQEQVMDVMVKLGGFSMARADSVRKIMSKWYRAKGDIAEQKLGAHREDFVSHAASIMPGGQEAAERVWNFCGGFSEYSFNFPHAGQYSVLGYADAFIKTHWPDCFYASLLTFPPAKIRKPEERIPFYVRSVREARLLGVDILPPDVNDSGRGFTVTQDGVRFGLESINGLGPASVADLVAGRPFAGHQALLEWTSRKGAKCNAGGRKALGAAGALDRWGVREEFTAEERAEMEEDKLGIALSVPDRIGALKEPLARMIHTQQEVDDAPNGAVVVVGGEVISGKEIPTKYNSIAARLEVAFGAEEYKLSVKPKLWSGPQQVDPETGEIMLSSVKDIVSTDKAIIARGTKDVAYDSISVDVVELAEDVVQTPEVV